MNDIGYILALTLFAGGCIPLGGLLATIEHIHSRWLEQEFRHFVIAFGGGILLGAVTVVLVPQGIENVNYSLWSLPIVLLGGISFLYLEKYLAQHQQQVPQLMGMLLDFFPEAIALGGLLAVNAEMALLLAILIGLQNLPEGFNAYRELQAQLKASRKTLLLMLALVPLGPIAGLLGYFVFAGQPVLLGGIMLFASGGILYLIFQDIAPQSKLEKHWLPPLGAVVGFCVSLFAEMVVQQF